MKYELFGWMARVKITWDNINFILRRPTRRERASSTLSKLEKPLPLSAGASP